MARRSARSSSGGGNLGFGGKPLRASRSTPRASVKRPARPSAATRAQSRSQQPGVASGKGLKMTASPAQKAAKVVGKPKSSGTRKMPSVRQGAQLGTPGRTGGR